METWHLTPNPAGPMQMLGSLLLSIAVLVHSPSDELHAQLEQALVESGGGALHGTVLVSIDSKVVFEEAVTREDRSDEELTVGHVFDLGSVSKQVTAAAILRLVDRGKLELDAPLSDVFGEETLGSSEVTPAEVLGHIAGIPADFSLSDGANTDRRSAVRELLGARRRPDSEEPYLYSNPGYGLAAAIVEEVSGQPFERFCEKELFRRARLDSAAIVGGKAPSGKLSVRRIAGGRESGLADFPSGWGRKGATGVLMSVRDVHDWCTALADGKVLEEESLARWSRAGPGGYGLGWEVAEDGERGVRLAHGGKVEGFLSQVVWWPSIGTLIVVLGDSGSPTSKVAAALEAVIYPDRGDLETTTPSKNRASVRTAVMVESAGTWKFQSDRPWNWTGGGDEIHAFLRDQEGSVIPAAYFYLADRDAERLGEELRVLVDSIDTDATPLQQLCWTGPESSGEPGWSSLSTLGTTIDPDRTNGGRIEIRLHTASGIGLSVELDRRGVEAWIAGIEQALED